MDTAIISKKQAKFARYCANKAFGKQGQAHNVGGKKERTYIIPGCALVWTEAPADGNVAVTVEKAVWHDLDYLGNRRSYDSSNTDFLTALDILQGVGAQPVPTSRPEDGSVLAASGESIHIDVQMPDEVRPVGPIGPVPIEATVEPAVEQPKAMTIREKLEKCVTMRLAGDLGLPVETPFNEIVAQKGTAAVVQYQALLSRVPSYGLTEARLRFAFPAEYGRL